MILRREQRPEPTGGEPTAAYQQKKPEPSGFLIWWVWLLNFSVIAGLFVFFLLRIFTRFCHSEI